MISPAIILVAPQMGENVGAAARAMANCGLTELRLVAPRDGWPNHRAIATASGAMGILDSVKVFETTREAVADLSYITASTARPRDLVKPVLTPEFAAAEIRRRLSDGTKCGILFGAERTGLMNEDIGLADAIITAPLNPKFTSLNLAQAVLLIGYEWLKSGIDVAPRTVNLNGSEPATKEELVNLFDHLEDELQRNDYFKNPQMKPTITANLRAMLQRAEMTQQEVRTFHGMIVALTGRVRGK